MWLYVIGLGGIGAVAGLFIGLSKSTVVGIALPLLLGLIGGAGALKLPDGTKNPLLGLGACLLAIAIGTGFSTVYGAMLRTGATWGDLLPKSAPVPIATNVDGLGAADSVGALLLEVKLRQFGADSSLRAAILEKQKAGIICDKKDAFIFASDDFARAWKAALPQGALPEPLAALDPRIDAMLAGAKPLYVRPCSDPKLAEDLLRVLAATEILRLEKSWQDWAKDHAGVGSSMEAWAAAQKAFWLQLQQRPLTTDTSTFTTPPTATAPAVQPGVPSPNGLSLENKPAQNLL
jgi:hypothetical protein